MTCRLNLERMAYAIYIYSTTKVTLQVTIPTEIIPLDVH